MSTRTERALIEEYARQGIGLNIGCGNWQIGTSIGLDKNPAAKAAVLVADGAVLPVRDGVLDYIVAMASLEHIPVSPLLVLKEWRRTLKVEGVCAVTVPDADYSVGWALCSTEDDHYHAFTLDTLRMYFVAAGFEVDRCERIDRQPVRPEPTLLCVGRKLASVTVRRDG